MPPAPGAISAAEVQKRKASDPVKAPPAKAGCATAAAIQHDGERDVPLWQQESEDEDF